MDCRVVEMDEELAGMFRDELRDYYDFTDQDIEPRIFFAISATHNRPDFLHLLQLFLYICYKKSSTIATIFPLHLRQSNIFFPRCLN